MSLDPADVPAIEDLEVKHHVLVFRGQSKRVRARNRTRNSNPLPRDIATQSPGFSP